LFFGETKNRSGGVNRKTESWQVKTGKRNVYARVTADQIGGEKQTLPNENNQQQKGGRVAAITHNLCKRRESWRKVSGLAASSTREGTPPATPG